MTAETRVTSFLPVAAAEGDLPACLVELSGPAIGKRYPLGAGGRLIGREPGSSAQGDPAPGVAPAAEESIVLDGDAVSRVHARISARDGGYVVEDLGSTNGTFVNERRIDAPTPLKSGDRIGVGRVILKFLSGGDVESQYHEAIYQLAITDGLTRIHNKRYFLEFLEREMGRCHRYARPLSLVLFDVDHFKRINDTHGHLAGDQVLRDLAEVVGVRVRKEQCLARYGGEEFAIALPEVGLKNAKLLAERIRQDVEAHGFLFEGERIPVTISLGVAELTASLTEPPQFISAADEKLYEAKGAGRNRVVA